MIKNEKDGQREFLYARLDDLAAVAARGELGVSQFLTLRELHIASDYLAARSQPFAICGGYDGAERCRVYLLPEYMEGLSECEGFSALDVAIREFGFDTQIEAIRVKGSGYRRLTHRDYLGSMLGLGLDRGVVGDILVYGDDGAEAIVLCDAVMAEFLEKELTHVANDKVRVSKIGAAEWEAPIRKTMSIRDTVASPRLDAVVAALCDLSRERAREAVVSGLVELDFEGEERPDRSVFAPATVSVRGYGRFAITSLSDKTRKGRYRLEAEKYV